MYIQILYINNQKTCIIYYAIYKKYIKHYIIKNIYKIINI